MVKTESVPGQCTWNFWWIEWHRDIFFSDYFYFPFFTIIPPFFTNSRFSTKYLQFINSAMVTMCHLQFSYQPINIKRPKKVYSDVLYQRLQNSMRMFVHRFFYADFETAVHNAVSTEAKLWKFPFKTGFGAQQAVWKKGSELSRFLKKILGTSLLPPAEVSECLRWTLYPIFPTTSQCSCFATTF